MKPFFIVSLLATVILSCFVWFWLRAKPQIVVTPARALIDEPVEISVVNLAAHENITLEASCKDKDNNTWISCATFQADDKGVVNVAKQAPTTGSYSGIDPMGLFWSIKPPTREILQRSGPLNIHEVSLSVFSRNKLRAQKTIQRLPVSPDVEKRSIKEDGVVGTLFYPKDMKNGPGVICVGGSGGRIPEDIAQLFASHGYAVLALGFFRVEGLPKSLKNIPLEYFQNAMQWFKKQPQVDKNHVAICGRSRGGELVLLLAATFPKEMHAAIAYVPSGIAWANAWTYNNKPIPSIAIPSDEEMLEDVKQGLVTSHKGTFDDPEESTSKYLYLMKKNSHDLDAATIPVENIQCPIFLISAEDDKMWPSTLFSNLVMERLDNKKSTIIRKHLRFPAAGHGVQNPYGPTPGLPYYHAVAKAWMTVGGSAEGNARADQQAWQGVLNFLKETLG